MEAVAHLTQGLDLLKSLPNTAERARQELSLQNSLGLTYMAVRGYAAVEVEHVYLRARELSQEVDDTMEQIRALMGLYVPFFVRANHEAVHALTEELLHLGQVVEAPLVLIQTYAHEGESLLWQGKLSLAQTHLEHGKSLYRPQQYAPSAYFFGHHPVVQNLSVLGLALWLLGYPERAVEQCKQAFIFAQELPHPFSLAFVLSSQARLYQWQRESPTVEDHAPALVNISTEKGFSFRAAHVNMLLGWAMVKNGEGKAGITQIEGGFAAYQMTGAKLLSAWWLALRAEAYGKIGQVEEGIALLVDAIRTAKNTGEHFYDAEIYRLKGDFLLQLSPDNAAEAETCFYQALDIARNQQAKLWELRTATSLAKLWQQQDKRQEAYDLLVPVYGWFTESFDTPDLIDAKGLLDALS